MTADYQRVSEWFFLGKTLKSHGTAGQIRLLVEDRFKSIVRPGSFLFFNLDGSMVPYRVNTAEEAQHFIVSMEGVDNKQMSDALSARQIFIPLDQVKSRHLKSPRQLGERWEEYSIIDNATGTQYTILRTEEYPQQLMAVIDFSGREVLIPLHDQLITAIEKEESIIRMDIPEGLLEL